MNTEITIGTDKFDILSSADRKSLFTRVKKLCDTLISSEIEVRSKIMKGGFEKIKIRTIETINFIKQVLLEYVAESSKTIPKKILKELDTFFCKIEKLEEQLKSSF